MEIVAKCPPQNLDNLDGSSLSEYSDSEDSKRHDTYGLHVPDTELTQENDRKMINQLVEILRK